MTKSKNFIQTLKPGVPKRILIFTAALVWTFAGGMLLFKGYTMLMLNTEILWAKIGISFTAGIIFFVYLFSNISLKHILRIVNLPEDRPCIFSFLSWRSYLLMTIMIGLGITLRTTGIIPPVYLSPFYIAMGTPLFMSAFRFYFYGFFYQNAVNKNTPSK